MRPGPNGIVEHVSTLVFDESLMAVTPAQLDAATIRVEDSQASIMLIAGADDQVWPSCRLAEVAMARLRQSGHATTHHDLSICYPDTGHWIGIPGSPTTEYARTFDSANNQWWGIGGQPDSIARAQRDSNTQLRAFLSQHL